MKPRINWKKVWREFGKWDSNEAWPSYRKQKHAIQRLVNAELRKAKKKGARK